MAKKTYRKVLYNQPRPENSASGNVCVSLAKFEALANGFKVNGVADYGDNKFIYKIQQWMIDRARLMTADDGSEYYLMPISKHSFLYKSSKR